MASYNSKKNNDETSETNSQQNIGSSHEQEGAQNQEGLPNVWWSNEYKCYVINGILAPVPISYVPPEVGSEDEKDVVSPGMRQPEVASENVGATEASAQGESSRRKRTNEGSAELFFKLFKFPRASEEYLLEMHEVKPGKIERFHVQVHECNGKWKVSVLDLLQGNHAVFPMLEDPTTPVFQKTYELSLQERLVGWTVEKRKRANGKEDKFYYHRRRQFRSFVEVMAYILYSCKLKDLEIISTNDTSQNVLAAKVEAAEAMMTISSSGPSSGSGAGK